MSLVDRCVEAAEQEGVKRTNRVHVVEQGSAGTCYGGWLGDEISGRLFDWPDAPVGRVHGSESSPSISKRLEASSLADVDEIVAGLREVQY